jgi:hypothetical protein
MAATGKVDSALAAGMRSDVTRPEIKPVVEVVKPQTDAAEAPAAGSETVKPADRAA